MKSDVVLTSGELDDAQLAACADYYYLIQNQARPQSVVGQTCVTFYLYAQTNL